MVFFFCKKNIKVKLLMKFSKHRKANNWFHWWSVLIQPVSIKYKGLNQEKQTCFCICHSQLYLLLSRFIRGVKYRNPNQIRLLTGWLEMCIMTGTWWQIYQLTMSWYYHLKLRNKPEFEWTAPRSIYIKCTHTFL